MRGVTRRWVAVVAMAMVLGSVAFSMAAESPKVPEIPGVTVQDTKPNGCTDCHRRVSAERDYSLQAELAALTQQGKHPKVSDRLMQDLPKQCLTCHKPGSKLPFGEVMHTVHLTGGADNHFISNYQGQCMYCHTLDPKTGVIGVKGL